MIPAKQLSLLVGLGKTLVWAILLTTFAGISLPAQDSDTPRWGFYRGPAYDGRSNELGLADAWPTEGPPVLWVRELGQGYSSFVGAGDRVFTQYQTLTNQYVICLNSSTGETVWEHRYDWSYQTAGLYPGPRSTPTLDGDRLYFTSPSGLLRCLDQQDGQLIWELDLPAEFGAEPVAFGYACSPVVVGNKIFLPVGGPDSAVVALDKSDGSVVWKTGDAKISYASVLPIVREGRQLLIAYLQNQLILMDQDDGRILSQVELSSGYDEHSAWPIYAEPYLWISAPFRNGSRLMEIKSGSFELQPVWQNDLLSNDICSSVLVDDHLFGFDIFDVQSKVHRPSRGSYRCLEFKSGRSLWQYGDPRARLSLSSPVGTETRNHVGHCCTIYADGKLILFNDVGDLILARADSSQYDELARVRVLGGQICWTQPMLLNRCLYVRNHKRVVCLYLGDPKNLLDASSATLTVSDVPQDGSFDLAAWILSVEPEYAMDAPTMDWMTKWYRVMLALGWLIAFPIAALLTTMFGWISTSVRRAIFRLLAIVLGVLGTTVISEWHGDFIFTWPLVLAIAFELLFYQIRSRNRQVGPSAEPAKDATAIWPGRMALLFFLGVCLVYFLLCRRLSLAFEWSFLLGFPAAIPFLYLARHGDKNPSRKMLSATGLEWLFTAIAFSAFYWAGVLVIVLKYGTQ